MAARVNKRCPCLKIKGKSRTRHINEHTPAVPLQSYPFGEIPANWPKALCEEDRSRTLSKKKNSVFFGAEVVSDRKDDYVSVAVTTEQDDGVYN
jgi:hypothetical protein